jgi:hypothetical protein
MGAVTRAAGSGDYPALEAVFVDTADRYQGGDLKLRPRDDHSGESNPLPLHT